MLFKQLKNFIDISSTTEGIEKSQKCQMSIDSLKL